MERDNRPGGRAKGPGEGLRVSNYGREACVLLKNPRSGAAVQEGVRTQRPPVGANTLQPLELGRVQTDSRGSEPAVMEGFGQMADRELCQRAAWLLHPLRSVA